MGLFLLLIFLAGPALATHSAGDCDEALLATYDTAIAELAEGQVLLANMKIEGKPEVHLNSFSRALQERYNEIVAKVGQAQLDARLEVLYEKLRSTNQVLAGQRQSSRQLRAVEEGIRLGTFQEHFVLSDFYKDIVKAEFSADQKRIILFLAKKIIILNADTLLPENTVQREFQDLSARSDSAMSPDGRYMAFRIDQKLDVHLIELTTGRHQIIYKMEPENFGRNSNSNKIKIRFSPDAKRLAVGDVHKITLFELERLQNSLTINLKDRRTSSLYFSPDSEMLVTAEYLKTKSSIQVYDFKTGKLKGAFKIPDISYEWAQFSANGKLLVFKYVDMSSLNPQIGLALIEVDRLLNQNWRSFFSSQKMKNKYLRLTQLAQGQGPGLALVQNSQTPEDYLLLRDEGFFVFNLKTNSLISLNERKDTNTYNYDLSRNDKFVVYKESESVEIYDVKKRTLTDVVPIENTYSVQPDNEARRLLVITHDNRVSVYVRQVSAVQLDD